MKTERKRLLREIVAGSGPELKRRFADLALLDSIMGREIDCIGRLREASITVALSSGSAKVREEAQGVLLEIGMRNADMGIFECAKALTQKMKLRLAELASVGHIVVGGPKRLLEATAILTALAEPHGGEHEAALGVLAGLGTANEESSKTFKNLVRIGALDIADMDRFIALRLEIEALKAKRSRPAEPIEKKETSEWPIAIQRLPQTGTPAACVIEINGDGHHFCMTLDGNKTFTKTASIYAWDKLDDKMLTEAAEALLGAGLVQTSEDVNALDKGLHYVLCKRQLVSRIPFKSPARTEPPKPEARPSGPEARTDPVQPPPLSMINDLRPVRSEPPALPGLPAPIPDWPEEEAAQPQQRAPIPTDLSAEALRSFEIKDRLISKTQMYQLICLHCFRLGTAKPMLGEVYGPARSLQSNLLEKIKGDPEQKKLFERCWHRMATNNAILLKKNSTVASLNVHTQQIEDIGIRAVVEWAFVEHRKLSGRGGILAN